MLWFINMHSLSVLCLARQNLIHTISYMIPYHNVQNTLDGKNKEKKSQASDGFQSPTNPKVLLLYRYCPKIIKKEKETSKHISCRLVGGGGKNNSSYIIISKYHLNSQTTREVAYLSFFQNLFIIQLVSYSNAHNEG